MKPPIQKNVNELVSAPLAKLATLDITTDHRLVVTFLCPCGCNKRPNVILSREDAENLADGIRRLYESVDPARN